MGIIKVKCNDSRDCCFRAIGHGSAKCNILMYAKGQEPYKDGECPFCKLNAEYTNGKYYPYDRFYVRAY